MQISEYLYVPLVTWALAQAVKFFIAMIKGEYRPSLLFSSGGMPSVHSATVSSLATVAFIEAGPAGALFGITGIFAAIVMYDSLGVRRAAGEQAKALNRLIGDLEQTGTLKNHGAYAHLREVLGHRPLEVFIGAVMGVIVSSLFLYARVLESAPWLLSALRGNTLVVELVIAGLLVVSGSLSVLLARRGAARLYKPFFRQVFISNVVMALGLLVLVLIQNQQLAPWDNCLTLLVVVALFVAWHLVLWYQLLVDGHLRATDVVLKPRSQRQAKWLPGAPKTRAARRRQARKAKS